jgi:hypothetical protein
MMESAGLARFYRVGRARVVEDAQVELVRRWLERRGLVEAVETVVLTA